MRDLRKSLTAGLAAAALLCAGFAAKASVVDLNLIANGDGRWYEYFSDAFCQVDGGPSYPGAPGGFDGLYQTSQLPTYTTLGGGTVCFPNGANFGNVGTVTVDDSALTGSGTESAPITNLQINFADSIADNDAIVGGYTTTISNESGTVTYENGVATSIDLTSDVELIYDFSAFGVGPVSYNGTFNIAANAFTLFVDDNLDTIVRYKWDVSGTSTVIGNFVPPVPMLGLPGMFLTVSMLMVGGIVAIRIHKQNA